MQRGHEHLPVERTAGDGSGQIEYAWSEVLVASSHQPEGRVGEGPVCEDDLGPLGCVPLFHVAERRGEVLGQPRARPCVNTLDTALIHDSCWKSETSVFAANRSANLSMSRAVISRGFRPLSGRVDRCWESILHPRR